ncbi:WD repeat-containing protein 27-like isoform X2 [Tympanuchus pallidicinctus]|nr:WD repeat-containing protein 27-like isoform X2 [Tympanuchus pallidicinctus]
MESEGDSCSWGRSKEPEVVREKRLFKSRLPECLVQVACGHQHCTFPLNRNELCVWNTAGSPAAQNEAILVKLNGHLAPVTAAEFCTWQKNMVISVSEDRSFKVWDYSTRLLMYQSGILTGERQNASALCKTNSMKPEGSVEASLPVLLIEHCDYSVRFHNEENICCAQNRSYFWIGTSTGLSLINLANLELEAFLCYKDYSGLSIQFARWCSLMKKAVNGKVLCLITSMFEDIIAVLEVNPALLVTSQQSGVLKSGNEGSLSVIARCSLLPTSPLCENLNKNKKRLSKTHGVKSTVKDQPLGFHDKIKSSGYTAAPQMAMFSSNTKLKKNNVSKCKTSFKG